MALRRSSAAVLRRVADVLVDAGLVVLALLGALVAASGSSWGLFGLTLALVGVGARLLWTARTAPSGWSPLGRAPVLRASLAAGTAAALTLLASGPGASRTSQALGAACAAAVLICCLVGEPFLARATRFRVPVATGLPGVPPVRRYPDLGRLAVAASVLATAAGLLLAWGRASAWWWLLVAAVAVLPTAVLAVSGAAKLVCARRLRGTVRRAVAAYSPEFIVYTARPDDASYQVTMWLPYLQRTGMRFLLVARSGVPAAALARLTDVPVVEARSAADLDALVVPSLRAVLYVNASSRNGALVRFQHLTHIYIGHGDSDKPPSYNPTHAMYDEIFAAGPAAIRRYAAHGVNIPVEKFRVVGRPQVEAVRPAESPIRSVSEPVVLYAPTWRGHVEETMFQSLPDGERIVSALLDRGATVIFRPHPFSYTFADDAAVVRRIHSLLEVDTRRTGRPHRWGAAAETDRSVLECINDSDAMVSDVSSVVVDYLFSGKPFAMVAVPAEPDAFVAEFPVAAASYVIRGDLSNLDGQLELMLGADPLAGQRLAVRADYLGDFPAEGYADAFVRAVQQVAKQDRRDLGSEEESDPGGEESTGDAGDEGSTPSEEPPAAADGLPDEDESPARSRGGSRYRRLLVRVGLDLTGTAVALLALAAALLGLPAWVVAVLAAVALGVALLSSATAVRRASTRHRLLTVADVTRAVLLVVLAVLLQPDGGVTWTTSLSWLALLMLGVALVAERAIAAAWGRIGLTAANLPGAVRPLRQPVDRGWLPLAGFAAVLVGFGLAWLRSWGAGPAAAGAVAFLLAAGAVFALFVLVLVPSLRRAVEVVAGERRLRTALAGHAPEFAVYFAATRGAAVQLGRWLPSLAQVGRPFVVVTRWAPMVEEIAQLCRQSRLNPPIVHRPTLRSLDDVFVPTLRAAFYVNDAARNSHFVERRELTHVWLDSGDAGGPSGAVNPVHAIYDLIFTADRAGIDRYAHRGVHIPAEKFRLVGRPQAAAVERRSGRVRGEDRPAPAETYDATSFVVAALEVIDATHPMARTTTD